MPEPAAKRQRTLSSPPLHNFVQLLTKIIHFLEQRKERTRPINTSTTPLTIPNFDQTSFNASSAPSNNSIAMQTSFNASSAPSNAATLEQYDLISDEEFQILLNNPDLTPTTSTSTPTSVVVDDLTRRYNKLPVPFLKLVIKMVSEHENPLRLIKEVNTPAVLEIVDASPLTPAECAKVLQVFKKVEGFATLVFDASVKTSLQQLMQDSIPIMCSLKLQNTDGTNRLLQTLFAELYRATGSLTMLVNSLEFYNLLIRPFHCYFSVEKHGVVSMRIADHMITFDNKNRQFEYNGIFRGWHAQTERYGSLNAIFVWNNLSVILEGRPVDGNWSTTKQVVVVAKLTTDKVCLTASFLFAKA